MLKLGKNQTENLLLHFSPWVETLKYSANVATPQSVTPESVSFFLAVTSLRSRAEAVTKCVL